MASTITSGRPAPSGADQPDNAGNADNYEETDMASKGIRDQVAIVGMGCTQFGEHWDRSTDVIS